MSSSSGSTVEQSSCQSSNQSPRDQSGSFSWGRCGGQRGFRGINQNAKGSNWTVFNIAAMVIGFVCFVPLGLFMVFWICTGRDVRELPGIIRDQWFSLTGRGQPQHANGTDNEVFNTYQQTQYDRISEIKEEIKERARRFSDFRADAKRRADEEEFSRFMSDAPSRSES